MGSRQNPQTDFPPVETLDQELDQEQARVEIEDLRDGIAHHDYLCYLKNAPVIADATYDRLFVRLRDLEGRFPELRSPDSLTRRVGAEPVSIGDRVTSSVSGETDCRVVGDNPGSKLANARAHGVRRIDAAAFDRLLAEAAPECGRAGRRHDGPQSRDRGGL